MSSSTTVDDSDRTKPGGNPRDHLPLSENESILEIGHKSFAGAIGNGLSAAIPPFLMTIIVTIFTLVKTETLDWVDSVILVLLGATTLVTVLIVSYRAYYLSCVITDRAVYTTNRIVDEEAVSIPLSEIERITQSKTLLNRIFGGGTDTLVTTHNASDSEFAPPLGSKARRLVSYLDPTNVNLTDIDNPDDIADLLRECIDESNTT